MTVGKDFCFSGFCPGRLESSGLALRCLFSVSDVRKSRDFALCSPPLSLTCPTEAVVCKQSLIFSADYSNPLQKHLEISALHCILPF
ncbi:hypothetical protein CDAR_190351 [Caerostris darwini]|uniref:Uncharacterized protein n=1 Tax=Caerostris darwini TaxID=1538125 RepID=A0AAV4MLG3_9ARAC|nr:hypothetical protein CDAR_190351 [Caerostris darwini]